MKNLLENKKLGTVEPIYLYKGKYDNTMMGFIIGAISKYGGKREYYFELVHYIKKMLEEPEFNIEEDITPLKTPNNFSLIDIFEELKYGRPKDSQDYLNKCIKELHSDIRDDIHKIISTNGDGFFDKEDVNEEPYVNGLLRGVIKEYREQLDFDKLTPDEESFLATAEKYLGITYSDNTDEYVDIKDECNEFLNKKRESNSYLAYFIEYNDGSWYTGNYIKDINGTENDIGTTNDPNEAFSFEFEKDADKYLEKHIDWFGKKEFKITEHEFVGVPKYFSTQDYLERENMLNRIKELEVDVDYHKVYTDAYYPDGDDVEAVEWNTITRLIKALEK